MNQNIEEGNTIKKLESFDFNRPIQIQTIIDDNDDTLDCDTFRSETSLSGKEHANYDFSRNNGEDIVKENFELEELIQILDDFPEICHTMPESINISLNPVSVHSTNSGTIKTVKRKEQHEATTNFKKARCEKNVVNPTSLDICVDRIIYTLSEHLICLADMFDSHSHTVKNNVSQNALTRAKKQFFTLSYSTAVSLILPQENNKCFTEEFLNNTIKIAKQKNIITTYEQLEKLYSEMLLWAKQKKEFLSLYSSYYTPIAKKNVTISRNRGKPSVEKKAGRKPGPNSTLFSGGPPGREIIINIDTDLQKCIIERDKTYKCNNHSTPTKNLNAVDNVTIRNHLININSAHNQSKIHKKNQSKPRTCKISKKTSSGAQKLSFSNSSGRDHVLLNNNIISPSNRSSRMEYPTSYVHLDHRIQNNFVHQTQNFNYNTSPPVALNANINQNLQETAFRKDNPSTFIQQERVHNALYVSQNYNYYTQPLPQLNSEVDNRNLSLNPKRQTQLSQHLPSSTTDSQKYAAKLHNQLHHQQVSTSMKGRKRCHAIRETNAQMPLGTYLRLPPPSYNYHRYNQPPQNRCITQTNESFSNYDIHYQIPENNYEQSQIRSKENDRLRSASIDSGFGSPVNFDHFFTETVNPSAPCHSTRRNERTCF